MKQGLQLKFSQQLTMTPQLQQAIKLLQLSTLELSQEITEQLYSNPLLEEITEDQDAEHQLKKGLCHSPAASEAISLSLLDESLLLGETKI